MKKIIFVTGNENKLREAKKILSDFEICNEKLDVPELQGDSIEIAKQKILMAYEILKKPCFIDDTSMECDGLNGLPGPYIKDFLGKIGYKGIYEILGPSNNYKAKAVCNIAYYDGRDVKIFSGIIDGKILSPRGESNFGFDHIFSPDGEERTFAEMTLDEKNKYSHRNKAMRMLAEYLKEKN